MKYPSLDLNSIRENMRVLEDTRRIRASLSTNQMIKGRRVLDTRTHILQIPQVTQSLEDRGSTVRRRLASNGIGTIVLNMTAGSIGGDQPSGHTATETIKVESVVLAVLGSLSVSLVVRTDSQRGGNVVEETTCLIEGDEEEGLVPLGTGADGIVDLLEENLTERDVAGGVHGVGVEAAAGGVDVGELGEQTKIGVLVEVLKGHDVALGVLCGPVEEHGIGQEVAVRAIVVAPRDALLGGDLEDAAGIDARYIEALVVRAVTVRGTCDGTETVGVGRLAEC
jgi:hypothetical protein